MMISIVATLALAAAGPLRHSVARSRCTPRMSDRQQRHKVVVTGVSAVTSCGHNIDEMMVNLLAGKSGIDRITSFDPEPFGCQIGSEVKDFPFEKYMDPKVSALRASCAFHGRAHERLARARWPTVRPRLSRAACGARAASTGGEAQRQVHAARDGDGEAGGGGRQARPLKG